MGASYLDEARQRQSIAAIATPPGTGAIGIVRLSGEDAVEVGARVFSKAGRLRGADSHTLQVGRVVTADGEAVDQVLALVMRRPRSYTGEDTVEFHTHGGSVQAERVLGALLAAGALAALPGEFTFRAFVNGRIDLTQAEGVADLVEADTAAAARVALSQCQGKLREGLDALREELVSLRARAEADIDFIHEGIPDLDRPARLECIDRLSTRVEALIDSFAVGRLLRKGAQVVIAGAPNVGKSSLFNALLRANRAIVTPIPGTTRDTVTESIDVEGLPVILTDTAGMRDSGDEIEREGVRRSHSQQAAADLVLEVIDVTDPAGIDCGEPASNGGEPRLRILNKSDLLDSERINEVEKACPDVPIVSAKTGAGVNGLRDRIHRRLVGSRWTGHELVITRERQRERLSECRDALSRARATVSAGEPIEILALELRAASSALDELVGRVFDDEILNRIFGEFCIGK